jgi:hypothetical protein
MQTCNCIWWQQSLAQQCMHTSIVLELLVEQCIYKLPCDAYQARNVVACVSYTMHTAVSEQNARASVACMGMRESLFYIT